MKKQNQNSNANLGNKRNTNANNSNVIPKKGFSTDTEKNAYTYEKIEEEDENEHENRHESGDSLAINTNEYGTKATMTVEQTKYENLQVTEESPPQENETDKIYLNYIEKLEKKVREQASRLSELEKYRYLCERMIKQLNPGQVFPVNETHLGGSSNSHTVNSTPSLNTISVNTKSTLECIPLEKYETLQRNYMNALSELNDVKSRFSRSIKDITSHDFPELDRIQNIDSLKDYYSTLLSNFKEYIVEKEEILEMLRRETLASEEQRNYIDVLRELLQSELIKSGVILKYISLDNLIDLNSIKNEADSYRKELGMSQNLISSLKSDNENLKSNNNSLMKNKDKVKQTLEDGLLEMDRCKQEVKNLELARDAFQEQISILKDTNYSLTKEKDELIQKNSTLMNKVKEISKISDDQNDLFMNRLNEYKQNFEKLNLDFEALLKDKTKVDIENSNLKADAKNLKEEVQLCNSKLETMERKNENSSASEMNGYYKKLYEDLNSEFEEFKKSQNKMSQTFIQNLKDSYKKSQDQIFEEHSLLVKETERLNLEIEKYVLKQRTMTFDFNELDKNYKKNLSLYEDEIKKAKSLQLEKSSISNQLDKIRDDLSFQKEKYEKDISNKNKEINNLTEDISSLKTESNKQKENLKELKKILNEKEDLIEQLNAKIETCEKIINTQNEKEAYLTEKSHQLESLSKKYNWIMIDLEDKTRDVEKSGKIIEELRSEKSKLEEQLKEYQKDVTHLDLTLKEKIKEIENLRNCNTKSEEEILKLKEKVNLSENKIKVNESDINEKENILNNFINEKTKLENLNEFLNKEFEHYKKESEDLLAKNKMLQDFVSDLKVQLYSIHSLLKLSVHKFNSYANEDLDSLLTKNFSQSLSKLICKVNKYTTDSEDNFIMQSSFEYIKLFGTEFENVYEKLIDSNNYIKEANGKIILLENSMNEISQSQGESVEKEKKLKAMLKSLTEEKSQLDNQLEELNTEVNFLRKEKEELYTDLKRWKAEVYSQMTRNDNLIKENQNLMKDSEEQFAKYCKLERENIVINKDKKNTENLLQNFVKCFPTKEIAKWMNEILNINEYIFKTEVEKMKIEEKMSMMEKEFKMLSDSQNDDLSQIVRNEQENLRRLISDFDKKICEKREIQRLLENEIYTLENQVKFNCELNCKLENELQRLQKEFDNYKDSTRRTYENSEMNKLRKGNNITNYANNSNPLLNNQIEISCLESNIFTENNSPLTKLYNHISEQQMTDYESLELEYSEDPSKVKITKSNKVNTINTVPSIKAVGTNSKNITYPNSGSVSQSSSNQMLDIKSLQESQRTTNRNDKINTLNTISITSTNRTNKRNINLI